MCITMTTQFYDFWDIVLDEDPVPVLVVCQSYWVLFFVTWPLTFQLPLVDRNSEHMVELKSLFCHLLVEETVVCDE